MRGAAAQGAEEEVRESVAEEGVPRVGIAAGGGKGCVGKAK